MAPASPTLSPSSPLDELYFIYHIWGMGIEEGELILFHSWQYWTWWKHKQHLDYFQCHLITNKAFTNLLVLPSLPKRLRHRFKRELLSQGTCLALAGRDKLNCFMQQRCSFPSTTYVGFLWFLSWPSHAHFSPLVALGHLRAANNFHRTSGQR